MCYQGYWICEFHFDFEFSQFFYNLSFFLPAPIVALFTVPVIGHWSDICTSRWGRRRPFIFGLSLFLILSLVLLCIGQNLISDPHIISKILSYFLPAPLVALFTVPVIGHWSDICTSRWGRRRPFIFGLSLFLILSLVLLCIGQNLVSDGARHNG